MSKTVIITDKTTGKQVECPVVEGTYGAPVIDTKNLYRELGMFTFDPGFATTASCRSAVTYLDGEEGILLHRGYPIDQLAEHSTFLEVCYLLINGELPSRSQMQDWENAIKMHGMYIPVRATVVQLGMFSAHADQRELMEWLSAIPQKPRRIFIVHGDPGASDELRVRARDELDCDVSVPRYLDTVTLR